MIQAGMKTALSAQEREQFCFLTVFNGINLHLLLSRTGQGQLSYRGTFDANSRHWNHLLQILPR
ncbi:MAG: hypothetical protein DKT66_22815 [Candidatus Melainabacteria bacterium]|nr:MAG: hypothetical protein DKT66_22815 [Candidatus Melainabacteria bacterium]